MLRQTSSFDEPADKSLAIFDTVNDRSRLSSVIIMFLAVVTICAVLCSVKGEGKRAVAFSASFGRSQYFLTDQLAPFTRVYTNLGNAYDNNTGVFTAPKTGVYVFSLFAHAQFDKAFCFRIFHNDVRTVSVCGRSAGSHAASANSVVLQVKSGDKIYAKAMHDSYIYENEQNSYSTFNGYLISP
ncbi:hypothetical protein BsWGS_03315 [Bradybaena similaris]